MSNNRIIVVDLQGKSNEAIKKSITNNVIPFTCDGKISTLQAFNDSINCVVTNAYNGTYHLVTEYKYTHTKGERSASAEELIDILMTLFGVNAPAAVTETKPEPAARPGVISCPAPAEIKESLDRYIISQDEAKRVLSVAGYNHSIRVSMEDNSDMKKANVMLIGPTGVGKTAILRALAEKTLHIPYCTVTATNMTAAGYVGGDVTDCLTLLLNQTRKLTPDGQISVPLCESGIIFIDEIDKIRCHGNGTSGQDVNGEAVQQSLLSLCEGSNFDISPEGRLGKTVTVSSRNILFVIGGAFPGLAPIIRKRLVNEHESRSSQLYGQYSMIPETDTEIPSDIDSISDAEILKYVTDVDLENFGFIPEFIGRFPIVCCLKPLKSEEYVKILREPNDALTKQYEKYFAASNSNPVFEDSFLKWIADECEKRNRGARGLQTVFENALRDVLYILPSLKKYKSTVTFERRNQKTNIIISISAQAREVIEKLLKECDFTGSDVIVNYM